jgi:hypothetical protein
VFWHEFQRTLKAKAMHSSAYHPQTDGQTERMNRVVEEVLRNYVSPLQDDWDEHLPFASRSLQSTTRSTHRSARARSR